MAVTDRDQGHGARGMRDVLRLRLASERARPSSAPGSPNPHAAGPNE